MKIDRKKITGAARDAMQMAGKRVREQVSKAVDAELIAQGKAAKSRQRARTTKKFLKTVGKLAAAAGAVAATVAVARSGNKSAKGRRA
jgi:negative regulator of sigma E activity